MFQYIKLNVTTQSYSNLTILIFYYVIYTKMKIINSIINIKLTSKHDYLFLVRSYILFFTDLLTDRILPIIG